MSDPFIRPAHDARPGEIRDALFQETALMNRKLTQEERQQIYDHIREFLADELEVKLDDIQPESKIIDDLGGDSMIYLELVEEFKKKFEVHVEIRVIGQYFQRHPVYSVGEVAQAVCDIVERGDELLAELEAELLAEAEAEEKAKAEAKRAEDDQANPESDS
jgi:acyl carrier protein